jgi:hypothetical protein
VVNQAQRHEDLWGMEVQFLTCSNLSLDWDYRVYYICVIRVSTVSTPGSSVSEVTRLRVGRRDSKFPAGALWEFFSSPPRPDHLWGPPSPFRWVPGTKRLGREADHSPTPTAEVRNAWSCTFTPQYVFITCYLVTYRDFTCTGCEWLASRCGRFTPDTHWIGCWMGPWASP